MRKKVIASSMLDIIFPSLSISLKFAISILLQYRRIKNVPSEFPHGTHVAKLLTRKTGIHYKRR